jgi:hypothetical protein
MRGEGLPLAMEFVVDADRSAPAGVGREVDRAIFRDRGKLLFNVFFGCCQVDVSRDAWDRPSGYREDAAIAPTDRLRPGCACRAASPRTAAPIDR